MIVFAGSFGEGNGEATRKRKRLMVGFTHSFRPLGFCSTSTALHV